MANRILDDQKPFDKNLNDAYDMKGKIVLEEVLKQGSYTNIIIRTTEMHDDDKSFWDVCGLNRNGDMIYFDVEVKEFWREAEKLPERVAEEGFSFPNRKSSSHNKRQNKTDYLVIISADLHGAFFVAKNIFESLPVIEKKTKFGMDKFRNVSVGDGRMYIKKDGLWQRQS
jgi:hypothetical protein